LTKNKREGREEIIMADTTKTETKTETKEETSEEISGFQQIPLENLFSHEPSAEKSEGKVEKEPEESVTAAEEDTTEKSEKEEEAEGGKKTAATAVAPNWDDDSNPYKQTTHRLESQYKNTRDWASKAYKLVKEYGLEESVDKPEFVREEEQSKELNVMAFNERERASMAAAIEQHGEEYLKKIYTPASPVFKKIQTDPVLFQRVFNSPAPVFEAIKIAKEEEFFGKYGKDFDKAADKIKAELEPALREKITKELQRRLLKKEELPKTLSDTKSKDVKNETIFTPTSLESIFGQ